jgi:CHAD domain-containing protein
MNTRVKEYLLPLGAGAQAVKAVLATHCRLVELESDLQTFRLVNEDGKTVARLVIEESHLDQEAQHGHPLPSRLQLVALKGHEGALAQLDAALREDLGLAPAQTAVLRKSLAAVGRRPAGYSSKIDYKLDPEQRADAAAKEILLGLLNTLEANVDGVKSNIDPEFLHDLRVATRRSRCALGQIKRVFPQALVREYKGELVWVQAATGKVRDLDVYLQGFDGYERGLPAQLRPHLGPLRAFLLAHYSEEHEAMVRALDSGRFRRLVTKWRAFLETPVPAQPSEPNAGRPAKAVADASIWRLARRVRREGRAITPDSPPEEMHELRKSCKKLRYLMEFFQSLYPEQESRDLIKQLKALLDNLGGFQDLAVQGRHLVDIARRMRDEGDIATETLLAIGALIGDTCTRQARARAEFADLFTAYDAKDNRERLKARFATGRRRDRVA